MTSPIPPDVDCDKQHASFAVPDVSAAVEFYTTKLGFRPGFTWGTPPTFAGVNLGSVQMFLEQGEPSPRGCAAATASAAPCTLGRSGRWPRR